jgi:hypothetical protein
MKAKLAMGLCLALLCSIAIADEPVTTSEPIQGDTGTIVITYNKQVTGRYIVEINVQDNGTAEVKPVTPDYHLGDDPGPGPDPDPDLTERALEIKKEADIVQGDPNREETAVQLGAVYAGIAEKVRDGDISGQANIALAVKYGGDFLLNPKGVADNWQQVRVTLNEQWVAVVQQGGKDADYAKLLEEAASGLYASGNRQNIDIEMILKIIKMIMEILSLISNPPAG